MKYSRLFFGLSLALAVTAFSQSAAAFSVGRPRGAAVLGQPMELLVPLQAAAEEDLAGLCVAADVYFGESPVEASQVRVRLESPSGAGPVVQVSVRKPVDEPVVTVYLRTGCQTQSVRKYVLLSEFASEIAAPQVTSQIVNASLVDANIRVNEKPANSPQAVASNTPSKPARRKSKDPNGSGLQAPIDGNSGNFVSALSSESTKKINRPAPARGGPRLKLQPLDVSSSWEPSLRITTDLATLPTDGDVSRRADAIALWRALSASPEEILQEAARRSTLEAELLGLQAMSRANQLALADLTQKLKSAQDSRFSNPLVYALFALLVACGAILAYVLRRLRSAGTGLPWWTENGNSAVHPETLEHENGTSPGQSEKAASRAATNPHAPPVAGAPLVAGNVDISLSDLPSRSTGFALAKDSANVPATKPTDFGHSVIGALRSINTQEMVDVRQQADFFLALGQHDEAIGLLQSALSQNSEANPYIYLDLIGLLHQLSRKDDYERLREVFNGIYTCYLPEFGAYHNEGRGLSDYSELCPTVVTLWPSRTAFDFIEHCIVRQPSDSAATGIDRAAFTDLLLLHGVLGLVLDPEEDRTDSAPPSRILPQLHRSSTGTHIDLDLS